MRIGLYGPYGWGNLGDAAIQESMMHNLRQRLPEAEFVGVSLRPENTEAIHGIEAFPIHWTNARPKQPSLRQRLSAMLFEARFLVRVLVFLRGLDVLIFSGGGQLSDDWGGPWEHPMSILKWTWCARLMRTKVYVVSVGVGPFIDPRTPGILRRAIRWAQYRSYRDQGSHDLIADWGFTQQDRVFPDLAFSLPCPAQKKRKNSENHLPRIGMSPMCYCYPKEGAWPILDEHRYAKYRAAMTGAAQVMRAEGHPILLFSSELGSDRYAFADLQTDLSHGDAGPSALPLEADATRDLDHLLEQIGHCDIVVTSRLHGVILAYLQRKAVIALSYDPKIDRVMETFGQTQYCLDIDEATAEQVEAKLRVLLDELDAARGRIDAAANANLQELGAQYDELFGPTIRPSEPRG